VRRWLGTVLSVVLALAGTAVADEASPSVVVIGGDPAFHEALGDTLVDNQIIAAGQLPTPALGDLGAESRRVADERGAVATVWLSRATKATTNGATLVTYDRTTDRFLVRELPYAPPLTATQGAEAARMVRTMLRALGSAEPEPVPAAIPPLVVVPAHASTWALLLGLGAWFAAPAADAAPQIAPLAVWRPDATGLALGATLAPAQSIEPSSSSAPGSFRGDVRDVAVSIEARTSLRLSPQLHVAPSAGLALHVVSVSGVFAAGGREIAIRRYDPAIRTGMMATVPVARALDVGIAVSVDCLLRRQKYEAAMEEILVVPRVQVMVSAVVGLSM
jgi:hypothetical protein